eukprot:TRINITY_DN67868_c2_g2_i1.p1 TRINITY_DN67868_c2_g2~~TRINITY_DN67868_c2_g2_i1.p1  ORF type:complete len:887 (+),score=163.54 TRINITY_DN67868_c2_g2_i1:147-2807(+)
MASSSTTEKKGILEEIGVSTVALESLERDFQEVLKELAADESLERFRLEYEKLHRALKKSHESEKKLIKKCQELNAEIVANAAKVQTALKLSQEDQNTIVSLKKEIEKAWKMVDAAHDKEGRAKDTIQQLKKEIANLSQLVEQGAGLTVGQENTVNELIKVKDELTKERDTLLTQIVGLREEIKGQMEKNKKLDGEITLANESVDKLQEKVTTMTRKYDTEVKKRERNDRELKELNLVLQHRQQDIKQKTILIQQGLETIAKLEHRLKEETARTDRAIKDYDQLQQRLQQNQMSLEEEIATNSTLVALNTQGKAELNLKEYEIQQLKQQEQKHIKHQENQLKQIKRLQNEKEEIQKSVDALKADIVGNEREIEGMHKEREGDKKALEDIQRERDILNKNFLKSQTEKRRQEDDSKVIERKKKNLEQEVVAHRSAAQNQRKLIYQLEKDREKYAAQASEATSKYYQALEEVKIRQMTITDLQKQISESEAKLKQQQNLYEAVRSDRNLYSKNLIEAHDEINEMKRKFKIMNHQIDQLKEEIATKEKALVEEHFAQKKTEKLVETLKGEIQYLKASKDSQHRKIQGLDQEINQLNQIIADCDAERAKQKKKLNHVMNERDILGTQLIRRNDELALLYEKIRIQQSTLNKGEIQYRDRLVDIRMLKLKINELKRNLHITQSQVKSVEDLKKQTTSLSRQLNQERTKVKALSEELENPMNVHRWRRLEGSDPKEHEMIQKVQTLQKRLIAKTEDCVEKEVIIQEKERLYVELKNILARQPGPEVAEQLNIYHENLRKSNHQMKRMASELNMGQTQVSEYKYEIERLTRELQESKKKFFAEKNKNQILMQEKHMRDAEKSLPAGSDGSSYPVSHQPNQPRFAGGGYSLSTY